MTRIELPQAQIARQRLTDLAELALADRGREVGHAVVVADPLVPIEPPRGHSVIAKLSNLGGELGRIGEAHAAFARGHDLVRIEGEACDVTELSDRMPRIACAMRFGAILDDI